jgi:hypothetical protein
MARHALLPLQLECTLFFQSNPYRTESIDDLAELLDTDKELLIPALDILTKQGIIVNIGDEVNPVYRYNEPFIVTDIDTKEVKKKA